MANGSQHSAHVIAEVTYGTAPDTPTMAAIRYIDFDIGLDIDPLQSAEIRSDRNVVDVRQGNRKIGGSFTTEVINDAAFESFLASIFNSDWATNVLVNGIVRSSSSILRSFNDLASGSKYHIINGVEFSSCELKIPTSGMATMTFDTIAQAYTTTATITGITKSAATTTSPMDSFTGVIQEGGATIALITEANIKFDNGLDRRFVLGSRDTIRPSEKVFSVTGNITGYFESDALLNKFIAGTASTLAIQLTNGTDTLSLELPKIKYTGGRVPAKDDGPILINLPFIAMYDATTVGTAKFTRS